MTRDSRSKPPVETACGLDAKHESDGSRREIAQPPPETPLSEGIEELVERLKTIAEAVRLYEGGPSAEEGAILEAALELKILSGRADAAEAANAVLQARAEQLTADNERLRGALEGVRKTLPDAATLLDTIKVEWEPTGHWSEWDASVRAKLTEHMLAIDAALRPVSGEGM